jgi:hypothetical protein
VPAKAGPLRVSALEGVGPDVSGRRLVRRLLLRLRRRTSGGGLGALEILEFKLDVLWQMNDAMALAYR